MVWLGAVWNKDIVDSVLSGARGFVSMSRFEGVPISVLEARQHGLPLILTDIPGHRDGAGSAPAVFVPVDDTTAFADATLALLGTGKSGPPDSEQLAQEWATYREGFLTVVANASGTLPLPGA